MTLEDFKDKRVTVMGIGLHGGGVGVIKFLVAQGAKVLATDKRKAEELKESLEILKGLPASPPASPSLGGNRGEPVEYVLEKHRMEDFTDTDMIIKNPAVPDDSEFLKAARDKKIPVESDIGIFLELCPAPIIGVSGTKGKSTTASLIAEILKKKFPQVILAGNIRSSVLDKLSEINKDSIVVLELSSWQLADAKTHERSPQVAVLTNILKDHLNRYANFEAYVEDKKLIFKFQSDKDFLFLNYDDPLLKTFSQETKSKVYFYSTDGDKLLQEELPKANQEPRLGAYLRGKIIYFGANQEKICSLKDIKLLGQHNVSNVLAAVSVAKLYDIANQKIKLALQRFEGLEGRLQLVAEINGVKYINDTAATSPDAAVASLTALNGVQPPRIVLISGGADKNLEFKEFGQAIDAKCKALILLPGTATYKITKSVSNNIVFSKAANMKRAVAFAAKLARPGDIVLLSPGCASFGLFRHEFERGESFNDVVASLNKSKM